MSEVSPIPGYIGIYLIFSGCVDISIFSLCLQIQLLGAADYEIAREL